MVDRKTASRTINNIIQSILDVGSHKKQYLALQSTLSRPSIVDQAVDYGYYWKESEKVQCDLTNMEKQTHILDSAVNLK